MSLNVRTIRSLVKAERPGMWAARNGLNLVISVSGSPCWSLRYTNADGKRRLMKLAEYEPVDDAILAGLEADAAEQRKAIRKGHDPLAEREAAERAAIVETTKPTGETFKEALWRNHHNPADNDNLRYAGLNGKQVTSNFKAMDWKDVPAFMPELLSKPDISAKALAITILCAVRSNETFNAKWSEFDLDNAVWTIPADRMKMGKEHRVPLSSVAVLLLKNTPKIEGNPYAFPGAKRERPLSNMAMLQMLRGMREGQGLTVHGFRSAFRDWITETTLHPDAIAELALAHAIDNKVERAYRRGDAFERRKDLMQQWADYLTLGHREYAAKWSKFLA